MVEEIDLKISHYEGLVTLIFTFNDLDNYIVRFILPTSIHITIGHGAPSNLIADGRTDEDRLTNVTMSSLAMQL